LGVQADAAGLGLGLALLRLSLILSRLARLRTGLARLGSSALLGLARLTLLPLLSLRSLAGGLILLTLTALRLRLLALTFALALAGGLLLAIAALATLRLRLPVPALALALAGGLLAPILSSLLGLPVLAAVALALAGRLLALPLALGTIALPTRRLVRPRLTAAILPGSARGFAILRAAARAFMSTARHVLSGRIGDACQQHSRADQKFVPHGVPLVCSTCRRFDRHVCQTSKRSCRSFDRFGIAMFVRCFASVKIIFCTCATSIESVRKFPA
jgi:hypothetical protein